VLAKIKKQMNIFIHKNYLVIYIHLTKGDDALSSVILTKIRHSLIGLSDRQKIVANFILSNHEDAAFLTSTQLAKKCGISESTVVRFAYGLGYERYADMQVELRNIVKGKLSQMERLELNSDAYMGSTALAQLTRFMKTDMESIEKTFLSIEEDELEKVVDAISNAKHVFVIGARGAYGLAHFFGYALSWIKRHVRLIDGPNNALFDKMADIEKGDVALAISTPPYANVTIDLLVLAQNCGATTIAITDSLTSPLAQHGTYCLPVHNEVMTFADNVAPILSLLTGLLALVGNKESQRSANSLEKLERFWEKSGAYYQENK